jgi:hypothetical protein
MSKWASQCRQKAEVMTASSAGFSGFEQLGQTGLLALRLTTGLDMKEGLRTVRLRGGAFSFEKKAA